MPPVADDPLITNPLNPTVPNALEQRALGATGLRVSPLCVGCAPLGDMPETFAYSVSEENALETIRTAFASQINFMDTAASYGDGESERRIGLVLRDLGELPLGYVLATKADRNLQTGDFSGDAIRRSVERSLRLLGVDRLQIVHLHDPEHTTFENVMSKGGPVDALRRLKDEGVIGHLGVAGGPVDMEIQYVETGLFELLITHNRYTLLNRSADALLWKAAERGMAVLNAAPYGSGILAKGPDAYARYAYQDAPAEMVDRARRMAEICARHGIPLAAAALHFSLRDPRVTSTIVGMSRPERIQQTIDLALTRVPEEIWPELDAVGYDAADPEANRWKQ
jgi:D-threo-aldose 1-dehydrogenase